MVILPDKRSLALVLLEAGVASRFGPAADRSIHATELFEAEAAAKRDGIKIWEGYSEAAAEEEVMTTFLSIYLFLYIYVYTYIYIDR